MKTFRTRPADVSFSISTAYYTDLLDTPGPPAHHIGQILDCVSHPILPILNFPRRPHYSSPRFTIVIEISRKSPPKRFTPYFPGLWGSL